MAAAPTINGRQITEKDSVFKPAMVLMAGRTLAFSVTFLIPVVLARVLSPGEFGTYKQLFLIWGTVYYIAQLGMASSLYYFLPRASGMEGCYVVNSMLFLGAAGLCSCGALIAAAPSLARWLSNGDLAGYVPWIGLYTFLMMLSMPLEIVLICRSRYSWASTTYAVSDLVRAAAFILPVVLTHHLEWLLKGAVLGALLRVAVTVWYFRREFRGRFRADGTLLRSQLAYGLPFGMAVLVEILQSSLPQYVVSHRFDPATLAIFAIGCLQIPLVDFAASPTSDVMMVRMQERLAEGRKKAVLEIWHDTTWKLALLFFPLAVLLMVDAREIIVFLFTRRYVASAPIFMLWSSMILLTVFQVDGVLRVFARTRLLLMLNLMRLVIIGGFIQVCLTEFHLLGGALVAVFATLLMKVGAMIRITTLLEIPAADLLPWRSLGALMAAAACAGAVVFAIKTQVQLPTLALLLTTGTAYVITYAGLVWSLDLLNQSERAAISGWLRKARGRTAALDCGRV